MRRLDILMVAIVIVGVVIVGSFVDRDAVTERVDQVRQAAPTGPIPAAAERHRTRLLTELGAEWGLSAPLWLAFSAAQIHQESAWRDDALSTAGAMGLCQAMPNTAEWLAEIEPRLRPADPWNPNWCLRAAVVYNGWLHARIAPHGNRALHICDHSSMILAAYNGGIGWLNGTSRLTGDRIIARRQGADPDRWFGHVEHWSARSRPAFAENRGYVRRIQHELAPRYLAAGWPGERFC